MPPLESAEGASGAVGAVDERHGVDVAGAGLGRVQLKFLKVEPDLRAMLDIDGSENTFFWHPAQLVSTWEKMFLQKVSQNFFPKHEYLIDK